MNAVVKEIGEDFIVHVVTDNGVTYKKAGEELMKVRSHLVWTPCTTYCVDLILKKIRQQQSMKMLVDATQKKL